HAVQAGRLPSLAFFGSPQCSDLGPEWAPKWTSGDNALGSRVYLSGIFLDYLATARFFAALSPPISTPAFFKSTLAASFAARAIAGSSRTRSCAIEPSTNSV